MKRTIEIHKELTTLNSYSVYGENGSCLFRMGTKYRFGKYLSYIVTGLVNGHFVSVRLNSYTQARQLFEAMEDR